MANRVNRAIAKRLNPVYPRVERIEWVIRTAHETRRFTSLSQMARSLSSNPIPDEEYVVLERNGDLLYRGLWGEDLHNPLNRH